MSVMALAPSNLFFLRRAETFTSKRQAPLACRHRNVIAASPGPVLAKHSLYDTTASPGLSSRGSRTTLLTHRFACRWFFAWCCGCSGSVTLSIERLASFVVILHHLPSGKIASVVAGADDQTASRPDTAKFCVFQPAPIKHSALSRSHVVDVQKQYNLHNVRIPKWLQGTVLFESVDLSLQIEYRMYTPLLLSTGRS